jgi:putative phosphoesterase
VGVSFQKAAKHKKEYLVGVISDTHGFIRPEVVKAFEEVDCLIHAGDIGKPEVLEELRAVAPVAAVRGNMDRGQWAQEIPETEVLEIGEVLLYVVHDIHRLDLDPVTAGFSVVLSGHSHEPSIEKRNGVLYLNPGSAGPRRFRLPVCLAILHICGKSLDVQLVTLNP